MRTIDFILKYKDLGSKILSILNLREVVAFSSICKKTSQIRINSRFDQVWRNKLYEVWLFQCKGKNVLQQYLSQFRDVVVITPKNKFWRQNKFIMCKFKWECYRDFAILGINKFDCEPILKNHIQEK